MTTTSAPTAPAPAPPTAPIADPGPLGLAGFAMTTMVLSCFNAGLLDTRLTGVVLPLALFYGGLCQLLAGLWEFKKGNTFGATAFCSYGAFWMAFWLYATHVEAGLPVGLAHQALGLFLLAWTIFSAYMAVAAHTINPPTFALFTSLALTFALLTIGAFGEAGAVTKAGGWFGLLTAAIAWGISFTTVKRSTARQG
ncbi:acetate uptake transporter [Streptomyces sp. NPDC001691]|uniref:acetate uptake transporter n=1 Tax=unclassified Streptomyces TaxID=2593676 RepID=UPI000DEA1B2E|nr:acetate uptake transporter family protein [Streptomyces sp. SDr-06]RCH59650.1 hypothetical protein DT019_38480 [Streptomyces sp. SDr-06]